MILSSSNGTMCTVEELKKVRDILGFAFERIVEVNKGTYRPGQEPIQFDFTTCPELANQIDSIQEIAERISKVVYQK